MSGARPVAGQFKIKFRLPIPENVRPNNFEAATLRWHPKFSLRIEDGGLDPKVPT